MTALADLLSPADRERLAARLAELRDLDSAMRERGGLPPLPPPRPLHKMTAVAPERPRTQEAGQHQPKGVTSK